MYLSIAMITRCKFHYKSGLYFLNFPSNVNQETIFTDGFESMSTWDKTNNSFGHSLTALDTAKKKSGSYSGRIDDNYPRQWSKYVYSDTWTPINNSQDTYYTVSGWVYVEDVTTNGSLPNLAKLWIVTRKQGERGYPTGHISTSSTKEGTWEYLSKTVLIPADVKEINVRIENARLGKVWFDDVKIVKGNTSQTVIVEESNYYPFGLQHKGYNNVVSSNGNSTAQKFKTYQGQKLDDELGLNWLSFKYRNYDPAIGRFFNVDPLAEEYTYNSTYAFQENKLGLGIELEGLELKRIRGGLKNIQSGTTRQISQSIKVKTDRAVSGGNSVQSGQAQEVSKFKSQDAQIQIMGGVSDVTLGTAFATGDAIDNAGDNLETAAIVAAPFTEGASLALLPLAEGMQITGKGMKIGVNLIDGNNLGAAQETVKIVVGKAIGKLSDKAISQSEKVGNITNATEKVTQEGAFAAIGKFFGKVVDKVTEIFE